MAMDKISVYVPDRSTFFQSDMENKVLPLIFAKGRRDIIQNDFETLFNRT